MEKIAFIGLKLGYAQPSEEGLLATLMYGKADTHCLPSVKTPGTKHEKIKSVEWHDLSGGAVISGVHDDYACGSPCLIIIAAVAVEGGEGGVADVAVNTMTSGSVPQRFSQVRRHA